METQVPAWQWSPIQGTLVCDDTSEHCIIGKTIILQNPIEGKDTREDSNVKVTITAQGSLQYDEEQGWKWHKSWILPDFKVQLTIKSSTGRLCYPPPQTYIEIFQAKQIKENEWVSVGMRGASRCKVTQGVAELGKGLRMSQTSYSHQGVRFSILIGGYVLVDDAKKFFFAYASPSIFVDSRKSDREFKLQREANFTELFQPEQIDKTLYKQVLGQESIEIENSTEGFYNFITASNLRNKIKHPIYLALKFPAVFHVLVKGQSPNDKKLLKYLEQIQTRLIFKKNISSRMEDELIIQVPSAKTFQKNRKLNETIKYLSTLVTLIRDDKNLQEKGQPYSKIAPEQIRRVFEQNFDKLQNVLRGAKQNLFLLNERDQKNQSNQEYNDVSKIVKVEANDQTPNESSSLIQQNQNQSFQDYYLLQNYIQQLNLMNMVNSQYNQFQIVGQPCLLPSLQYRQYI